MEGLDFLISDLALILVTAGVITVLFKKINQPVVLGYVVAGFLISPHFVWLPTVIDEANIHVWANIGIIFLMFALGLEFSFHKIAKVGGSAIIVAITVIAAMILLGFTAGDLMGWGKMDSIFLGGMICMSSTMIILKAYEELKLKEETFAQLVLGVLVLEDIAGIFMMIVLSTISVSKEVSGLEMMGQICVLLLFLVLMLVLGIYIVPSLLKKARRLMNNETLLIVSLGFCLLMVVISVEIGFSSALGAFLAGSILAGTVYAERIDRLVQPIKDLFGAIFFVSVGMMVVPNMLLEYIVPILIITVVVILGQMIFSGLGVLLSGQSLHTAVRAGFSMVQIGEFSFIIASLGMSLGVISDFLYPIVVCVSVITTFTTPIFIKCAVPFYAKLEKALPEKTSKFLRGYTDERQVENDKDDDWKHYLAKYFSRLLICGATLFVIYLVGTRIVAERFYSFLPGYWGHVAFAAIMFAAMAPFISLMYSRRSIFYTKLWIKNVSNRLPLMFFNGLRLFICVLFVVLTFAYILNLPIGILLFITPIAVFLIIKSDFLKSKSLKMESRFVANFNERILEKKARERGGASDSNWVDKLVYVVEFGIKQNSKRNKLIRDYMAGRVFGIMIIKIIRGETHINLPKAATLTVMGDRIVAIGTKAQIESYLLMLEKSDYIEEPEKEMITLREYMHNQVYDKTEHEDQIICCAVPATRKSGLVRKSIKDSGYRANFHGFIIGIERGSLPIIGPDKNMEIEDGDILWVLGTEGMMDLLLRAGLMEL